MQEAAQAHERHVRALEREQAVLKEKLQDALEQVKDAKIEASTRVCSAGNQGCTHGVDNGTMQWLRERCFALARSTTT